MSQQEIQSLVDELKSLRVQSESIRHKEDQVLQELHSLIITGNSVSTTNNANSIVTASPIVTARVISARDLQGGDRVRITNSISNIIRGRDASELDRLCTVRRVTPARRVLVTTDSGVLTWRYSKNLSRIEYE